MDPLTLPRHPRYHSLDLWRGVACLMVIISHASFYATSVQWESVPARFIFQAISYLWIGVPIFFVISGYCISAASDSIRRKPQALSQYFLRRFRRIFPPFWAVMALSLVLVTATGAAGWPNLFPDHNHPISNPSALSLCQWIGNFTLTEQWRSHLLGGPTKYFLDHTWSLCYEEQFYAVCGLVLFLAPRRLFSGLFSLTLLILAITLIHFTAVKLPIQGFFFDGSWLLFAAGIVVYYRINYASEFQTRLIDLLLVMATLASMGLFIKSHKPIFISFLVGNLFALTISLLHRRDTRLAASAWLRPISFCGKMCYSMYLVHYPITKAISHALYLERVNGPWQTLFITIPLSLGVSVGVSWLFHLTVERRFLNSSTGAPIPSDHARSYDQLLSPMVADLSGS